MRFQVPQFIEVEDKIFGPLTIKQFIYLLGGGGTSFIIYTLVGNFFLSLLLILPIIGLTLALAFFKMNNRPFLDVIESAFHYYFGNKLYIWKKIEKPVVQKEEQLISSVSEFYVPKLSDSKLKDLTWSLDIKQSSNPAQRADKQTF